MVVEAAVVAAVADSAAVHVAAVSVAVVAVVSVAAHVAAEQVVVLVVAVEALVAAVLETADTTAGRGTMVREWVQSGLAAVSVDEDATLQAAVAAADLWDAEVSSLF